MSEQLNNFMAGHRQPLEEALGKWLPLSAQPHTGRLNEALLYAVFPGGKRWRPMLTLLGAMAVGASARAALPAACAIEFLHTSSLILDDLPAMDDADVRRGRAALHLAFGEGLAVLAALALLNQAYSLLMRAASESRSQGAAERLIEQAVDCIGADGMIGGQVVDLDLSTTVRGPDAQASRNLKTTALMRLTMTAGAIAYGAEEADIAALAHFGERLGAAYQICDDLLDELGESEAAGKPMRQDTRHRRSTSVAELGIEGAHRLAESLVEEGKSAIIKRFGECPEGGLLADAADHIVRGIGRLGLIDDLVA